jgi:hypothetical protein
VEPRIQIYRNLSGLTQPNLPGSFRYFIPAFQYLLCELVEWSASNLAIELLVNSILSAVGVVIALAALHAK